MLIPIGSWCRCAYQVNEFIKSKGGEPISYPFDWTITPFASLQITFSKSFNTNNVLANENLLLSPFGSLTDISTKLIHHHDFDPQDILRMKGIKGVNENGVPLAIFDRDLIMKAKGRLIHTYNNLEKLKNNEKKIGFIRWIRTGQADPTLPNAFEGETLNSLSDVFSNFLGHDNFSILQIRTEIIKDDTLRNSIISYKNEEFGVSAVIAERRGFNGDGTTNFRGEVESWNRVLNKFIIEENITL